MESSLKKDGAAFNPPFDWLLPQWPAPAHVHALCTTRAGGVSTGPYEGLNLGDHVQDDPAKVEANRQILAEALSMVQGGYAKPVFMSQVHGTHVQWLNAQIANGVEADACATLEDGVGCVIMVADCLPVLFTNREGTQVAAAHAGWRGLAGPDKGLGVLEQVVAEFGRGDQILAWLGPCIGPDAFEVGVEVRKAFCDQDASAEPFFKAQADGKFLADLAGLARHRLKRAGVTAIYGNDSTKDWCTVSNPARFFSYRRDQRSLGGSGRLAAAIWLDRR